jgi:hypothetical protein
MLYNLIHGRWLDFALGALGIYAIFATLLQTLRATVAPPAAIAISVAVVTTAVILVIAYHYRRSLSAVVGQALRQADGLPLWSIVLLGLVLRAIWVIAFPAAPGSDGAAYLGLAEQLAAGGSYETDGTRAYWPVGYPLFLAGWLTLFPDRYTATLISNLFIYLMGLYGTYRLASELGASGNLAALLFALWPNLVFQSGTPEKEMLIVAFLPWITFLAVRSIKGKQRHIGALVAGGLVGAAALVQPSLQFLALLLPILLIASIDRWRSGATAAGLLFLGATLVVAPWTLRNYQVFGDFVLIATNGGDNFYRANNPLATGGWTPKGAVDLNDLDELERDRIGKALGLEWIRENPSDFAALALEKQVRFLGDDAVGVYTTLKVGGGSSDALVYAALKALANAWWIAGWIVLLALIVGVRQSGRLLPPYSLVPAWLWLYLFVLHTVFESAGKYHVPALWALCVLLALYAVAPRPKGNAA